MPLLKGLFSGYTSQITITSNIIQLRKTSSPRVHAYTTCMYACSIPVKPHRCWEMSKALTNLGRGEGGGGIYKEDLA